LPLVHTLRDYGAICARSALFKNGRTCTQRCVECVLLTRPGKQASRLVDQLVGNSDYTLGVHRKAGYFAGVSARRLFNVVPLTRQERARRDDAAQLVFGFIGRIEAEKGIEVVLAACARLGTADWRLRIAGTGGAEYVEDLRRRFPDQRIEWLDHTDADAFYRSVDVLLMASIWPEPLPRTLIEALAHGLPAICAEAGGIPEIAGLAARTISYPPTDVAALAAAMTEAIRDKTDWRSGGGFHEPASLTLFSEAEVVARHREVYRDAVSSSLWASG
jgi:glycosyltransferase involved in cell wall biosynthesis